jgi:UDP-glucuronate decarboxylase
MNPIVDEDLAAIRSALSNAEAEKFRDSTVLVTGCAGFLGYYFMHFLGRYAHELGIHKIIGVDTFILRRPEWLDTLPNGDVFSIYNADISKTDWQSIADMQKVDLVIHMASIASPTYYRQYPIETLDANIWGLRHLLNFYVSRNIKGLLFFSSSEIYGDPDAANIPTDEEYRGLVSCTGPRACYDESKRFGETICMLYAQKYNMPISVARPFNNYGPGMSLSDKRAPADFASAVMQGKDIIMFSDGTPTRTFCYISDAIAGYLKVLTYGKYGYFNIGIDRPEISIKELAQYFVVSAHKVLNVKVNASFRAPPDITYLMHNPNRRSPIIIKARKVLAYDPKIHVADGVERFLKFLKHEQEEK